MWPTGRLHELFPLEETDRFMLFILFPVTVPLSYSRSTTTHAVSKNNYNEEQAQFGSLSAILS
jgi:hypothetical protein